MSGRVSHHHYTVRDVLSHVRMVLEGSVAMRAAARVTDILSDVVKLPLGTPQWSTIRLWLMRLGHYKLTRPKERADDWVWLIDHSVQIGSQKCLMILGIRLSQLPAAGECLRYADLEPIELLPVETSTKQIVYEQLEAATAKTGVPRAILDDHGADLHGGVERFRQAHPQTIEIYDVKHKAACLLKRRLQRDPRWAEFSRRVGQTKFQVQQTELAFLMPPSQRSKARYMNLEPLIRWGQGTLRALDERPEAVLAHCSAERLELKFGWLADYREALREWSEFVAVIETVLDFVREQGLYSGAGDDLKETLESLQLGSAGRRLAEELQAFVRDESLKAHAGERLPGSTEVLESCFGKLKSLEREHSRSGFTGFVLSLCAVLAPTTAEVVGQALQSSRTKEVLNWCHENLGLSVQSKRKLAYNPH
ncbi:MAG: hypothetical protein IH899_15870 [Planctomycetes bacterium]|nr:hypothetical protein [Planctomycetota bacterium]